MSKKKVLYLGLNPPYHDPDKWIVTHYPVIKILYRNPKALDIKRSLKSFSQSSHLIFTSKTAVKALNRISETFLTLMQTGCMHITAVGQSTAAYLKSLDIPVALVPTEETAEGICIALNDLSLNEARFFWPHSALSRQIIPNYLSNLEISLNEVILYDTVEECLPPYPDLDLFDEFFFTSPSSVRAFFNCFKKLPAYEKLKVIGPITQKALEEAYYDE